MKAQKEIIQDKDLAFFIFGNNLYGNDGNNGSIDLYVGGVEREINLSMAYLQDINILLLRIYLH